MTSRRILIVDDEKGPLAAWQRALTMAGYSVSTAQNAEQALRECDEHSFDLVVLDFIMPSMDGIELLRRIRKTQPFVRSIVVSAKIDEAVAESDISGILRESVEADLYLHKTVSNERLKASIEELLTRAPTGKSWQEIAKKARNAHSATIQSAKKASKDLRGLVKKKGRKR